jgi:hypothetical protein
MDGRAPREDAIITVTGLGKMSKGGGDSEERQERGCEILALNLSD